MKKFLTALLCAATAAVSVCGFAACDSNSETISFYMPDGAPALAAAQLMAEDVDLGADVNYNVVNSTLITTYVTGDSPEADVCILPVNAAVQLLGSGETYQLLGTVTHGNLYIVSKTSTEQITLSNLGNLVGKTVGVVNLSAVPGLTFKVILSDNNLEYAEVGNDGVISETAVNLAAMSAASDLTDYDYDYYVIPEPAMTTLTNKLATLNCVGSLQTLYGSENGYPQAVLVAKCSLISENSSFITKLINAMAEADDWLLDENTSAETIVSAVYSNATEGMTPTFTAANLNSTVIENCAINYTPAVDCREEIISFIAKYSTVSGRTLTASDSFFYNYTA